MKRSNVSIFIPHNGCPHKCSFCDQKSITGSIGQPTLDDVKKTIDVAMNSLKNLSKDSEIAFFGGSFTAIDENYMISLLDIANEYVQNGIFKGIRVSTRPDTINDRTLNILKSKGVSSIELGAQSMDDNVLLLNNRGHTSDSVVYASNLIKEYGFCLGLQMMTGLYGSNYEIDYNTGLKLAVLEPDTVRIYPTVIIKNTMLYDLYRSKKYVPMEFGEMVELCSELLILFDKFKIPVIRLGLHASDSLEKNMVAGCYHPAFREICESRILFNKSISILKGLNERNIDIYVNPSTVSKMVGQKRENIKKFKEMGYSVNIKKDKEIIKDNIRIEISR